MVNRKTRPAVMGQYYDAFSCACVIIFISVSLSRLEMLCFGQLLIFMSIRKPGT